MAEEQSGEAPIAQPIQPTTAPAVSDATQPGPTTVSQSVSQPISTISQPITTPAPARSGKFLCPWCTFSSENAGALIFHKVNLHRDLYKTERESLPKNFKCKRCGEPFETKWKLMQHTKRDHPKPRTPSESLQVKPHESEVPKRITAKSTNVKEVSDMGDNEHEEPEDAERGSPSSSYSSEPILRGPAADAYDRTSRLQRVLDVMPLPSIEKNKKWIIYMWQNDLNIQQDANKFFAFLMDIKTMEIAVARRIVDSVFISEPGAPPTQGYPPYYGAGQQNPASYGYQTQYSQYPPQYPQQPGYPPQYPPPQYAPPQVNVAMEIEKRVREEREKWEKAKEIDDLKGMIQDIGEKIKNKGNKEGYIIVRKQLIDAEGHPALNPDGSPAIQEMEVPAYQAAMSGLGAPNPPPQPDMAKAIKDGFEMSRQNQPQQPNEELRVLRDELKAMQQQLNDTKMTNMKTELASQMDSIRKDNESRSAALMEKITQMGSTEGKRMQDEAVVALEELKQQGSVIVKGLDNANKTVTTGMQLLMRGNQSIPEQMSQPSEDEKRRRLKELEGYTS